MPKLLEVENLKVSYGSFTLHELSFCLDEGEILAVVGESGSGKTTLLRALSRLADESAQVSGRVCFAGQELYSIPPQQLRQMRWSEFSIAFQNSAEWLNPSMSLRAQLLEILKRKPGTDRSPRQLEQLMETVGLEPGDLSRYPHELSGGMAQKFLLASAIALRPRLVLMDEPTSALDAASREHFAELIRRLNREYSMAFIVITHDMKLASMLSDRMMVLYNGHVEELGQSQKLIDFPMHPYTRGLINASAGMNPFKDVWGIRPPGEHGDGHHHGCPFARRCTQTIPECFLHSPQLEEKEDGRSLACIRGGIVTVLECRDVSKAYGKQLVLESVSMFVRSGELVAVVGKSAAGKSTLAGIVSGYLDKISSGELLFMGQPAQFEALHRQEGGVALVYQDSEASLNPNMSVLEAVKEPRLLSKLPDCEAEALKALGDVGLPADSQFCSKLIKTLSGGQKQRVSIARSLSMKPALLVADEPTSMLDPSSAANLMRLLKLLQNKNGFSMILVTHDLDSAVKIADRCYLIRDKRAQEIQLSAMLSSRLSQLME